MERRAKIIATLGPSSENEEILRKLILEGLDIVRLNFSHGNHETHLKSIESWPDMKLPKILNASWYSIGIEKCPRLLIRNCLSTFEEMSLPGLWI